MIRLTEIVFDWADLFVLFNFLFYNKHFCCNQTDYVLLSFEPVVTNIKPNVQHSQCFKDTHTFISVNCWDYP